MAAARRLMREQLGWLRGFPVKFRRKAPLAWRIVPEPHPERTIDEITVTRELLRKTTFAFRRLQNNFPRALPRLVKNRKVWCESTEKSLSIFKEVVHKGGLLPEPSDVLELFHFSPAQQKQWKKRVVSHPQLVPLLNVQAWLYHRDPDRFDKPLRIISKQAGAFEGILARLPGDEGLFLLIELCELIRCDGGRHYQSLIKALADARSYTIPLNGWLDIDTLQTQLTERLKVYHPLREEIPDVPEASQGKDLVAWTKQLSHNEQRSRKRALALLDLVLPQVIYTLWKPVWDRVTRVRERAVQLTHIHKTQISSHKAKECLDELEGLKKIALPPRFPPLTRLFSIVDKFAGSDFTSCCRDMVGFLSKIPEMYDNMLIRIRFLVHWHYLYDEFDEYTRIQRIIGFFRDQTASRKKPYLFLALWKGVFSADVSMYYSDWNSPEELFLDKQRSSSFLPALSNALKVLIPPDCSDPGKGEALTRVELLYNLIEAAGDGLKAASLLEALVAQGKAGPALHVAEEALSLVFRLRNDEVEHQAAIVNALSCEMRSVESGKKLPVLLDAGRIEPELVEKTILWGGIHRVEKVVSLLSLLQSFSVSQIELPLRSRAFKHEGSGEESRKEKPDWLSSYPHELWPLVEELESIDCRARKWMRKSLGKTFPDHDALKDEIRVISSKLKDASTSRSSQFLNRRLENLTSALSRDPETVSKAKIRNSHHKLERRIATIRLKAWEDALQRNVKERCPEWMTLVDHFSKKQNQLYNRFILAISQLSKSFRTLTLLLLRAREGAPPWDLRDAPENRAFLACLRNAGVNAEPWLNGIEPIVWITRNGDELRLQLEDDPLKIFMMGEHFKTCLSPGGECFYSVVANAADINKRVLYACDSRGTVQGRCLLALTNSLKILTFHPYTHRSHEEFENQVNAFVYKLAERMRTSCAPSGSVDCLESTNWYDDGSLDLTGQFDFLKAGSTFRKTLLSIEPKKFRALLRRTLPQPVTSQLLRMVLGLSELQERSELLPQLFHELLRCPQLDLQAVLDASRIFRKGGLVEEARELWRVFLRPKGRLHGFDGVFILGCVDELLALEEHQAALNAIKRTRSSGNRCWEDEDCEERLFYAARALEGLHRPKKALALYWILNTKGNMSTGDYKEKVKELGMQPS